jgi:hypothetical protein
MDLTRMQLCYPEECLADIIDDAVKAIIDSSITRYWAEVKPGNRQQFALVVWIEALCNLCMLSRDFSYRRYIAEAAICAIENDIGLPPVVLGSNPEAVKICSWIPCPSPIDSRLHVINLSCKGQIEVIVVNCSDSDVKLHWQGDHRYDMSWKDADGQRVDTSESVFSVSPRRWLVGLEVDRN